MLFSAHPTPVIFRQGGEYIEGVWQDYPEPAPVNVSLAIQGTRFFDEYRMQNRGEGQRQVASLKMFGPLSPRLRAPREASGTTAEIPGDIVIYENERWLVTEEITWNSLSSAPTNHRRYIIQREIEKEISEEPR